MSQQTVLARDLELDDSVYVPGEVLHDDLSGLCCVLRVDKLLREDGRTKIYDKYSDSWTWFRDGEELQVSRRRTA
jgi:hypothetical protein